MPFAGSDGGEEEPVNESKGAVAIAVSGGSELLDRAWKNRRKNTLDVFKGHKCILCWPIATKGVWLQLHATWCIMSKEEGEKEMVSIRMRFLRTIGRTIRSQKIQKNWSGMNLDAI